METNKKQTEKTKAIDIGIRHRMETNKKQTE
jgi:hypothetical protein